MWKVIHNKIYWQLVSVCWHQKTSDPHSENCGLSSRLHTFHQYSTCVWLLTVTMEQHSSSHAQGRHSPVLVKFPDFSRCFPQRHQCLLNHQRYTDRIACTPEWILWHYWQSISCMSTLLNSTQVMFTRVPTFLLTKNPGLFQDFPGPPWEIFQDLFRAYECLNKEKNPFLSFLPLFSLLPFPLK